jgi:Protein of unknown function (DUF1091)
MKTPTQARFSLQHRQITPFYGPVLNVTLDICEFLAGSNPNLATKWWFDMITKTLPKETVHPCPYIGMSEFPNMNIDPTTLLISHFFTGHYKSDIRFFDEDDANILRVVHVFILTSVHDGKRKKN